MAEKTKVTLQEVLSLVIDHRGKTVKKMGADFSLVGHRVISAINIKDRRVDNENLRYVSSEIYEQWMKEPLRAGDVLLTSEAPLGELAYVEEDSDACLGQRLFALRGRSGVLYGRYLFYALSFGEVREDLLSRATGTTVTGIRQSELLKVRINLPPFAEQKAIADVLGVLDGKIDSNRRMADLLIRLARTMMSVGQYEARLGDIAKCERGLSYKGDGLEENSTLGVPMINLANFGVDGWLNAEKMKFYSGEYKDRHLLKAGDLVVANTDLTQQRVIIGRPALVPPELGRAIFTHHVTAIRPIEDEELSLPIWAQLNTSGFRERAEGFATGTTVAGMPVETLLDFQIQIPDGRVISDARDLLQRVWAAETESRSLTLLRDTLLVELLSGRLRVKDAESMMENV